MTPSQIDAYRMSEANMVKAPYIVITSIFLLVVLLIYFSNLPEWRDTKEEKARETEATLTGLKSYPHLLAGAFAQFCYVGAQVGVASFIIRFAQYSIPGIREKSAAHFLQLHMLGFMIGRFAGSAIMKRISPSFLLRLFAACSIVCLLVVLFVTSQAPVWAVVLIGFFHSIMFPTIFALSLKHLGMYTKLGSSVVVMAIIGGAIFPALMGLLSDATNIRWAFLMPLLCHAFVFYFGARGYKPCAEASTLIPSPLGETR